MSQMKTYCPNHGTVMAIETTDNAEEPIFNCPDGCRWHWHCHPEGGYLQEIGD